MNEKDKMYKLYLAGVINESQFNEFMDNPALQATGKYGTKTLGGNLKNPMNRATNKLASTNLNVNRRRTAMAEVISSLGYRNIQDLMRDVRIIARELSIPEAPETF
jgi:hypothetical protein